MKENFEQATRLRALRRMRDNGQFVVATLLRETADGFCAPDASRSGLTVLHGIVPTKFLRRMESGRWQHSGELMTTSDLCSALVAGFELGGVQLRLVLPLLGRELRDALSSLPPEEPLRLCMTAEENGSQSTLKIPMGPGSAKALAELVEDDHEDSAYTLGTLLELTQDVACLRMGQPDSRQWPPLSPDVVVMTVMPTSLVRATAELMEQGQALAH